MSDKLMSDERQAQLLKAAEETVGLLNIGVDPDAALAKVAEDSRLNDHEVDVVAHAVNNSRQLAHLQSTEGDDRESAFPLIDPDNVRAYGEVQPTTNADVNTGNRYGAQEVPGENVQAKLDAPDAPKIQQDLLKAANSLEQDYRLRPDPVDHAAVLRQGWALSEQTKVADYQDPNPFSHIDYYRIGLEEASLQCAQKTDECLQAMGKVASEMRRIDAPEWSLVEKTAALLGADSSTLDMIYSEADIQKFGSERADLSVKTAGQLRVSQRVMGLAQDCVRADTLWKQAADVHAARQILTEQCQQAEAGLFPKEAASAGSSQSLFPDVVHTSVNVGDLAEPIERAPEEFSGLTPEVIQHAIGGGVPSEKGYEYSPGRGLRQNLKNVQTRAALENLMSDEYIGGHSLPEVIDAYNAAVSINPDFGQAELVSYIRQHLASQGGMPLDLQIRARAAQKRKEEG